MRSRWTTEPRLRRWLLPGAAVSQYIGIDLHKAKSFVTRLDHRGLEAVKGGHCLTFHWRLPYPLVLWFASFAWNIPGRSITSPRTGNAQQRIFLDETDRRRFVTLLGREILQQHWRCSAYCLMNNHHHLLIETPEANLSRGMRRLNGSYTQWFNRRAPDTAPADLGNNVQSQAMTPHADL